jgi:uncharacterized membrane protein HdeD (DUF308 family)
MRISTSPSGQTAAPAGIGVALRPLWPVLAARGVFGVCFGLLALLWPLITVVALALLFGAYALIDGVSLLVQGARHHDRPHHLWTVLGGLLGVAAGITALIWPMITALVLATVIGAWALVTGITELIAAVRLRHARGAALVFALAGALSAVAGVLILLQPGLGALSVAMVIGAYAVIYGIVIVILAFRLRALARGRGTSMG